MIKYFFNDLSFVKNKNYGNVLVCIYIVYFSIYLVFFCFKKGFFGLDDIVDFYICFVGSDVV